MIRDYADRSWVRGGKLNLGRVVFLSGSAVSIIGFSLAALNNMHSSLYSFITISGAIFAVCAPVVEEWM